MDNLFADVPSKLPDELVETLLEAEALRVLRIVSTGHASPDGFWYDQAEHEWVVVLSGSAVLRFQDGDRSVVMQVGDYVHIPAGQRHRVESTSADEPTIWLAIFYRDK